jgi:transposase
LGDSGEEACCKSVFVLGAAEEVQPTICYILEMLRRFSRHSIMLRSNLHESIPPDTVRVAHAALNEGNRYRKLKEHFDTVFSDHAFADLFPIRGQPAATPWRLALVTVLQFAEGLSDREAAEAVRARIDWKYLLGLELTDPGFDYSILSRFRDRLIGGKAETLLLQQILDKSQKLGLIRKRSDMRTDATHVVASVRNMNRSELVGETLRAALNVIATVDPKWLAANVDGSWYLKYAKRFESNRAPLTKDDMVATTEDIGLDGMTLLERVWQDSTPQYLRTLPAIEILRQCWVEQFWVDDGVVRLRHAGNLRPSPLRVDSPYDPEARYGIKRTTEWIGYKVHFTEVCSRDVPHLITNVDTVAAYTADAEHLPRGQDELSRQELLPGRQFVDGAYVGTQLIIENRKKHGIQIIGPVKQNSHHSQESEGYDLTAFKIDWERQFSTCPQGKRSTGWWVNTSKTGRITISTKFSRTDCRNCAANRLCTKNGDKNSRKLTMLPREEHELLAAARAKQQTPEWKKIYNMRAGIEGTISQGVRSTGLRRSRYRGQAKTHLQNVAIACAINLQRLTDHWSGVLPAQTRTSTFARLGQWVM